MKKKILFLTVGGSSQPNVTAINSLKPDYIFFVCTKGDRYTGSTYCVDGEGYFDKKTNKKTSDNLLILSEYKNEYEKIELDDPDDLNETISKIKYGISKAKDMNPEEIILDYTGGTKTMSAASVLIACNDRSLKLTVTKGVRTNIISTEGVSITELVDVGSARFEIITKTINQMLSHNLYTSAKMLIDNFLVEHTLEPNLKKRLEEISKICLIFEAWDKFNHKKAFEDFRIFKLVEKYPEHFNFLRKILEKDRNTGYEILFDLIKNAERKAANLNYDDAIARIYRAIEMFLQIRLKKEYNIDSSNIDLNKARNLPDEVKEKYKDKNGKSLGLMESYEFLKDIDEKLRDVLSKYSDNIKEKISTRNISILAHGKEPITKEDYKKFKECLNKFIEECFKVMNEETIYPPDFPQKI